MYVGCGVSTWVRGGNEREVVYNMETMKYGLWRGAAIALALVTTIALGSAYAMTASAQEVTVNDNEYRQCVDTDTKFFYLPSDEGYDECVAQHGEQVVVEVPAPTSVSAPVVSDAGNSDGGCSSFEAVGGTSAWVLVKVNGVIVADEQDNKDYAISGETCVELSGGTDEHASGSVK